jgi:3-phenylpropionate/trans-cinnamate dioxygenase ferredoxin reductase subunit
MARGSDPWNDRVMSEHSNVVIVGASLAGAKAAEALREKGHSGAITLIGDEAELPYERPPLSKAYLQGSADLDGLFVHDQQWYADNKVDLRLGCAVTAIDRPNHEVVLEGGERLHYDQLLLTTGSSPRHLDIPGTDLDGVHYLRRIGDSDRLRAAFQGGAPVAIIGAGWIGLETAAASRSAGLGVTVLEMGELPLLRVLGPEVAQLFADLHTRHGVDMRFGVQITQIVGEDGSVTGVALADGTTIPAGTVVVGVGITPNVGLAEAAGLDVGDGIIVDQHLRSSDPDIFAAGDVACAFHPRLGRHVRVEHWANALNQPAVAAGSILGEDVAFDRSPYFFTDQYDLGMEYTGHVEPGDYDTVVFRGDPASGEYIAFWTKDARVLAGMNVNIWDVTDDIKALVQSGRQVDLEALADPGQDLSELAAS